MCSIEATRAPPIGRTLRGSKEYRKARREKKWTKTETLSESKQRKTLSKVQRKREKILKRKRKLLRRGVNKTQVTGVRIARKQAKKKCDR